MAIILKISVRFTLKELKCEFSSSFDSISGYEEGVLHIAVMFGKKKKKKRNGSKRKHRYQNNFTNKKKKRPFNNLTRNITSRERVFFS